jgi:hypothetical protein
VKSAVLLTEAREMSADGDIYQIKVTLKGSRPPIWRTVQLSGDATLEELHHVIQIVMDWEDYHMHEFVAGGRRYGVDEDFMPDPESERSTRLREVAPRPKSRIFYEYDFGDGWEHDIRVEKVLPPEEGVHYPRCIRGKRAAPPEDCGGIWGYYELLDAIENPDHPDHEDMLEWIGGELDPEALDLGELNRRLQALR